jgi:hypothetical protein
MAAAHERDHHVVRLCSRYKGRVPAGTRPFSRHCLCVRSSGTTSRCGGGAWPRASRLRLGLASTVAVGLPRAARCSVIAAVALAVIAAAVVATAAAAVATAAARVRCLGSLAGRALRLRTIAAVAGVLRVSYRRRRQGWAHPNLCRGENFRAIYCDAACGEVFLGQRTALRGSYTLALYCFRVRCNNNGCYGCRRKYEERPKNRCRKLFHYITPTVIKLEK